jgi:cell cycle checkpoint protein
MANPATVEAPDAIGSTTVSSNNRRNPRGKLGSFSIHAEGDFGSTELDYPNDKDVMDRFECAAGPVQFRLEECSLGILSTSLVEGADQMITAITRPTLLYLAARCI